MNLDISFIFNSQETQLNDAEVSAVTFDGFFSSSFQRVSSSLQNKSEWFLMVKEKTHGKCQ